MISKSAIVGVRENKTSRVVSLGYGNKPQVEDSMVKKWQKILDTLAQIVAVPSCLIMQLREDSLSVFLKNNSEKNLFAVGQKTKLTHNIFCETVIGNQQQLKVSNIESDSLWNSIDLNLEMGSLSYVGVPLNWSDGDVFGTICMLDDKKNEYSEIYCDLLNSFRDSIEKDLELIESKKMLIDKNSELEHSNKIKTKFLALISHDIRGSMATLTGFIEFVLENQNDFNMDEIVDCLSHLGKETNNAFNTLESLLEWAKNDLVKFEAQKERTDLCEMINNVLGFLSNSIQKKNIDIQKNYAVGRFILNLDPNMIESAFRNILSNAIKFTNAGNRINISLSKTNGKTFIEVEDFGIGMTKLEADQLVSGKQTTTKSGTHGEKGAGIGLVLAKEFIDKNGGEIFVESRLSKGTKITIQL